MARLKSILGVVVSVSIFLFLFFILEVRLSTRQVVVFEKSQACFCNSSFGTPASAVVSHSQNLAAPAKTKQSVDTTVESEVDSREYYSSRIFRSPVDLERENFTIVIMTYRRFKALKLLLRHYCRVPSLDRIVVVWNDLETAVSKEQLLEGVDCSVPILLSISKENRLTNRYLPREEIKTDCVVTIDDDRKIDPDDILFGFKVWQQFRHRIVGFEHRMHVEESGTYFYGPRPEKGLHAKNFGYSLMISASSYLHKAYLEMFHDPRIFPRTTIDYVDHMMNCEDLAICVMVAKFLEDIHQPQCAVLSVQAKGKITNMEMMSTGTKKGLSYRADHTGQRSQCLNKFAELYNGVLPLRYTHARIVYVSG